MFLLCCFKSLLFMLLFSFHSWFVALCYIGNKCSSVHCLR